MPRLGIDTDEWYPVYTLTDFRLTPDGERVDVDPGDYDDYQKVMAAFNAWQKRLEAWTRAL